MLDVGFYADPGPFTELTQDQLEMVARLAPDPQGLCRAAEGLVVAPADAAAGLPDQRMAERDTRPASLLLERLLELDGDAGLDQPRPVAKRVVGTCRHFAVLATAFHA